MKVLLLFPKFYSLDKTFKKGLEANGCEVYSYDYRDHLPGFYEKVNSRKVKLTQKWRSKWEEYYFSIINKKHIEYFYQIKPELVLIYNNEMLLPETVKKFRTNAKVLFFLGDNPFYTPTSSFNLSLLFEADHILCPDTGWIKQLEMLGLNNLLFFIMGSDSGTHYKKEVSKVEKEKYESDLVFVGGNYDHSWGYKRCLFLNEFAGLDLKLYGPPSWKYWLDHFPDLQKKFIPHKNGRLSYEKLNTIMNCGKIYPVDANPGLINGVHLRVFECIASGILPIVEYRKDLYTIFKDIELPIIYNYKEAKTIAKKYIENDGLRIKTVNNLFEHLLRNYSSKISIQNILSLV